MTPEDVAGIERAGLSVLGELDGSPDAFYQRTRMRLEQLDGKLLEWGTQGERAKVLETLAGTHRLDLPQAAGGRSGPAELRDVFSIRRLAPLRKRDVVFDGCAFVFGAALDHVGRVDERRRPSASRTFP